MKIIRDGKAKSGFKFTVEGRFLFEGDVLEKEQTITPDLSNDETATLIFGMCQIGKLRPELPEVAVYECVRGFTTEASGQAEEVKVGEHVELDREIALPLLINGSILPTDDSIYSPSRKKKKITIDPAIVNDVAKIHGSLENWVGSWGKDR